MKKNLCFVPVWLWLSLVAAAMSVVTGCVAENVGDCVDPRGNVHLVVSVATTVDVSRAATRVDVGGYEIERAHLYVFDTTGRYVTSAESDQANGAGRECEFWLTLPSGDYDFVVWTNLGESYRTSQTIEELQQGEFTMNDLEISLDHRGDTLTETIPHLLHGITRGQPIFDNVDNRVEVEITPKTYTVNLRAINLPEGDDDYAFTITDNNSHYTFEGELIEDKPLFTQRRTDTAPGGEYRASIRTLTLSDKRHPRFTFTNATTGTTMHDADLISTITRAYRAASRAVDFSSTYVYDIVLSFDATKMEFTVSVNGWEHDEIYKPLNR